MKNVAFLVSLLAHPVVIPLYALFIIFHSGTIFSFIPLQTQYTAYLLTITGPVFIPLACLPLLKYLRLIDSYAMWNKQERIFPDSDNDRLFFCRCLFASGVPLCPYRTSVLPAYHHFIVRFSVCHESVGK